MGKLNFLTELGIVGLLGVGVNCVYENASKIPKLENVINESVDPTNNKDDLREMIQRHEGWRNSSYLDTLGNRTIGVGYSLERSDARKTIEGMGYNFDGVYNGSIRLSDSHVEALFEKSLREARNTATSFVGSKDYNELNPRARNVLIDMAFNMGPTKLGRFNNLRRALQDEDYRGAADAMVNSRWYSQVGNRSLELVGIMRGLGSEVQ